jgi:putative chitinase
MENLPSPCGLSGTLNEALTQIDSLKQKIAGGLDSIGDLGAIADAIKEKLGEIKVPEIPELDLQTELASLPYLSPAEYTAKIAELKKIFGSAVDNLDELIDKIPKPPLLSSSSENLVEQLKNLAAGKLPDTQSIIDALTPEGIANAISDMCKETPKVVVVVTTDEKGEEVIGPVETKPEATPTPTKNPEKEKAPSPPPASGFTFAFTKDKLEKAGGPAAAAWYDAFAITLPKYGITTPDRVAAFVAQIRVESGDFKALKEKLGYSAKVYYNICANRLSLTAVEDCARYLQTEKDTATGLYEKAFNSQSFHKVARNLGNTEPGDGYKFIGRGLKQLTGRYNYTRASKDLYGDDRLLKNPELVATDKQIALETACWFWNTKNLSAVADAWDITTLSKKVNGGTIGLADRIKYSDLARSIMKA